MLFSVKPASLQTLENWKYSWHTYTDILDLVYNYLMFNSMYLKPTATVAERLFKEWQYEFQIRDFLLLYYSV